MIAYLREVGAGLSHLFNAITGGKAINSFSARVGAAQRDGKVWAIAAATLIDFALRSVNHCIEHAREEGLI